MFIKNRHLQLLPDGTVNGTTDENSDYTILQRTTVNIGQIKIQGAATCLFLCMDSCGFPYSSKDFTDECIFNEMLEQHHYNTYSSRKYSGARRTIYLALDARGQPRRVALPARRALGKLSGYVRTLTKPAHRALHACTKNRQSSLPAPPKRPPCRVPKKKRKCKEGERPAVDNCERAPKMQRHQAHRCPPHKPDCAPARNVSANQPLHIRHKRPMKQKKINEKQQLQQLDPNTPPLDQNNKKKKKKNQQQKEQQQQQQQKNRRKVGRALEDGHTHPPLVASSWEVDDGGWMLTSEEMLSSTQVDDVTPWEFTTNSGNGREFFRPGSAVQETAEEDDS